jgi:hypothetical protein
MTTPNPEAPAPTTPVTEPVTPQDAALQPATEGTPAAQTLVDHKNKIEAENKNLRTRILAGDLQSIGLEIDKGLGKAIAKDYRGDFEPGSVAAFAKDEYQYEHEDAGAPPQAQQIVEQQQQADALQTVSSPILPQTVADRIAEHDTKMMDPESKRSDAEASVRDKTTALLRQVQGTI